VEPAYEVVVSPLPTKLIALGVQDAIETGLRQTRSMRYAGIKVEIREIKVESAVLDRMAANTVEGLLRGES
jgi:hypothetical protein